MIVRIMEEGQYRLDDAHLDRLNELDNVLVVATDQGDRKRYQEVFDQLLKFIRGQGQPLPEDELHGSDVIIPSEHITFEEAQELFTGEGLVPD